VGLGADTQVDDNISNSPAVIDTIASAGITVHHQRMSGNSSAVFQILTPNSSKVGFIVVGGDALLDIRLATIALAVHSALLDQFAVFLASAHDNDFIEQTQRWHDHTSPAQDPISV